MGKSLFFPTNVPLMRLSQIPTSFSPHHQIQTNLSLPLTSCSTKQFPLGFHRILHFNAKPTKALCTKAVISEVPNQKLYPKVGAHSTGSIPTSQLLQVVETAAKTGAEVVMDAVNKPRNITYKGVTDLVTDTDKASEAAILDVVKKNFRDHLVLGEEGGIIGDTSSDYLWCIDPLDGTTNFAHCYPSFAVSVGVLFRGKPAAASVVEFVGGPMCWSTRTFSATAGGGAFCNGQKIHASQTDQGVRRLGAAAVDMCHVALGIVEAYWEYRLKPWDMAAGVLIVEEAGGSVSRMDGGKFCVFDRSVLVSNGALHAKLLERIAPATEKLKSGNFDDSLWFKPENYTTDL
ncbi:hypothetical protein TIFTF001_029335 [Ficus carica]|uniref:Inositol-1-monophosphatase n=1 Tax=Ficus carica TaxID=3494 RepID=A0AA88DRD5_FICCA|nr:hypothetical protein TIFTF001_029335 [Ficus carica]